MYFTNTKFNYYGEKFIKNDDCVIEMNHISSGDTF